MKKAKDGQPAELDVVRPELRVEQLQNVGKVKDVAGGNIQNQFVLEREVAVEVAYLGLVN